jgi:tetratricopeptide (TPR) repeat protein
MIGKTLAHYKITSLIGRGGMGVVYQAKDQKLGRDVAIKVLPEEFAKDADRVARFQREAKLLASLNHPNIASIYGLEESDGTHFLVLELVEGDTLADRIKGGPIPAEEALKLALQIAEALEAAHEHGIIHRDIKPTNIMLGVREHVKVMDFGLAKQSLLAGFSEDETASSFALTEPGAIVGTLEYMPPEQLRGKKVDGRSDIFSLGITLCEALTGKNPLRKSSHADTISEILSDNPVPLPISPDSVPSITDKILRKMVEKNPEKRYQSVKDLLVDLHLAQAGGIGGDEHLRTRPKLKALAFAGLALGVAVFLAALVWYLTSQSKPVLAFQERDWIVVADFENQTGESLFDESLDTALRMSLEQSSFVNLLSKSRIDQILKRMKKPEVSTIDEPIAREIAQREGINILLVPSITGIAGSYMISTTLEDAASGDRIKSDLVRVRGKDDVLAALDKLAEDARRSLGEKSLTISRRSKQLAQVTTPSLEALKQYSLGIEAHKAGKFEQAKTYYENALSLDPNFALAEASLGAINFEKFNPNKGKQLLSKAVRMIDNLTDREKYGILAAYSQAVENDIPKTIQQWKMLSACIPTTPFTTTILGGFAVRLVDMTKPFMNTRKPFALIHF